jgi:hypothetical protein
MLLLVGTRMAMLNTHTHITTSGGKYSNLLVLLSFSGPAGRCMLSTLPPEVAEVKY